MNSTLKIGFCALALTAASQTCAGELGRLFFTPEQRAQLDYNHAREARSDTGAGGSINANALTLSGIVQMHGGKRTAWINGVPQVVGSSDEKAPESVPVPVPGQNKPVKLKVGQRILLSPSSSAKTLTPNSPKQEPAKKEAAGDD